ncbi:flagellar hook-basal body complex protein [Pseudomonas corrugata]
MPPDARNLVIKQNGEVQATITETGEIISVGQVQLAKFASAEALTKLSDGLYRPTQASGEAIYAEPGRDGQGVLLQGFVEMSNVNLIDEMSGLVLAQRAYQMNARLLQASDQILKPSITCAADHYEYPLAGWARVVDRKQRLLCRNGTRCGLRRSRIKEC